MNIESRRFVSGGEEVLKCSLELCADESFKYSSPIEPPMLDAIQHAFMTFAVALQTIPTGCEIFVLCDQMEQSIHNYLQKINERERQAK